MEHAHGVQRGVTVPRRQDGAHAPEHTEHERPVVHTQKQRTRAVRLKQSQKRARVRPQRAATMNKVLILFLLSVDAFLFFFFRVIQIGRNGLTRRRAAFFQNGNRVGFGRSGFVRPSLPFAPRELLAHREHVAHESFPPRVLHDTHHRVVLPVLLQFRVFKIRLVEVRLVVVARLLRGRRDGEVVDEQRRELARVRRARDARRLFRRFVTGHVNVVRFAIVL